MPIFRWHASPVCEKAENNNEGYKVNPTGEYPVWQLKFGK